jgi:predicted GNAT family acetyltransferase
VAASVGFFDDPAAVLERAGRFLETDPVRHNIVLSLLRARVATPEPGRYWVLGDGGGAAGVVFQSPTDFVATLTPMDTALAAAAVDAVVDQGVALPGVSGEAATAAAFAGHWAERTRSGAQPVQGLRIYELAGEPRSRPCPGALRAAGPGDAAVVTEWVAGFFEDTGEVIGDPARLAAERLAHGEMWLWDDGGPVSMAGLSPPEAGVVRVGHVFTPRARRASGYASALVAAASAKVRAGGHRCILYTDLGNPTSNAIYRAIGYRPVAECLKYRFDPTPIAPGGGR